MKIFHLSDLHFGKKVNGFSMIEEQEYIILKILQAIDSEKPDALLIAGDVYDKSIPSAEAVRLFDKFLFSLSQKQLKVFIISGNHDSAQRLSFASRLISEAGIYISPAYDGNIHPCTLTDEYGKLNIYMLPFIKPADVRAAFKDIAVESYNDAVRIAIENMHIDTKERNILVCHQFVTGSVRCDSEEVSVGGIDNVDANVFDGFDYVALGHIHSPQWVGREAVRYCGTPLKYSFSEANHKKSITVVELKEKGKVDIKLIPLEARRDLKEISSSYEIITSKSFYESLNRQDYYRITLTDEEDIYDAVTKLRVIYPNLMKLDYSNRRTAACEEITATEKKSELEYFAELYEKQNGCPLSDVQAQYITKIIEEVKEED